VDAGVHQLQGKAEFVTAESTDTLGLLVEFYLEKITQMYRHQQHATQIKQYDANNTYQYIINRDEVQLTWLATAITDLGGAVPEGPQTFLDVGASGKDAARKLFESDAINSEAFISQWRPRVEAMTNARHRGMLRVILGETREQQRFFEQALAGRTDLLGRRAGVDGEAMGEVLPTRWIE
jgi:hypothetical protein